MDSTIISGFAGCEEPVPVRSVPVLHVRGPLARGDIEAWLINVLRRLEPRRVQFDCRYQEPAA
jgi:hypothetical protein